jgi:Eukaryotic DNA topoisomerase I, catalytic core
MCANQLAAALRTCCCIALKLLPMLTYAHLPSPCSAQYEKDWLSKDEQKAQIATALYFIDILALRAGHEKDEEEADTVGCCNLKVHFGLHCANNRSSLHTIGRGMLADRTCYLSHWWH